MSIDSYINKLLENNIKTIVDVRKNAYSNKFGFTKKEFQYYLEKSGIKYIHIPELGIESEKRKEANKQNETSLNFGLFATGKSATEEMFEEYRVGLPSKKLYTDRLLNILKQDKMIAITYFEADYKQCHMWVLAKSFEGINVVKL